MLSNKVDIFVLFTTVQKYHLLDEIGLINYNEKRFYYRLRNRIKKTNKILGNKYYLKRGANTAKF